MRLRDRGPDWLGAARVLLSMFALTLRKEFEKMLRQLPIVRRI
jgi:hypothetical protein